MYNVQEKVEPPTTRVASDVGTEAAVKPMPALGSVYVAQGEPDAASDATLGPTRRHLKFDLDEVERVHAKHGHYSRADACKRMVLQAEVAAVWRQRRWCPSHKHRSVVGAKGWTGWNLFAYDCMCWEEARV